MILNFFSHGFISTTSHRAKILKPAIEKFITKYVKKDSLLKQKYIASFGEGFLNNKEKIDSVVKTASSEKANGGYLKIIKIGNRRSDGSEVSILKI